MVDVKYGAVIGFAAGMSISLLFFYLNPDWTYFIFAFFGTAMGAGAQWMKAGIDADDLEETPAKRKKKKKR